MSTVSILIEWENVLLAEDDRCFEMLRRLNSQIGEAQSELGVGFEVVVLFNPEQVTRGEVEPNVTRHLVGDGLPERTTLRLEPIVGEHYYDLRNRGAQIATGDTLVCIDSDVVPEPGWLLALLNPMLATDTNSPDRPGVVTGQTFLDTGDLVSRAFGAGWIFAVRDETDRVEHESPYFFANNIAFRRSVFLEHPYPSLTDGQTRGSCARLAKTLRAAGVPIWYASGARGTHPAPNGVAHICVRALAHGRDNSANWKRKGRGRLRRTLRAVSFACDGLRRTLVNSFTKRRELHMPAWQIPPAVAIMAWYYALTLAGSWTATLLPTRLSQGWRV